MPKIEKRVHTPLVSEKQRGLFGAELARRRAGEEGRMPGITEEELARHLRESKGKDLPETTSKLCKRIDDFINKAYPQVCSNCGTKIYATLTPTKCPKCESSWVEKVEKRYRYDEEGSPVERLVEEREGRGITEEPEKTGWRAFTGGRAVTRPGSKLEPKEYYHGPRGGYGRPTGDPWRKLSWRMPRVKSLIKSVNNAISTLEDKIVNDMRNEIKTDNTQRAKQLAENISSKAKGEQIRKQKPDLGEGLSEWYQSKIRIPKSGMPRKEKVRVRPKPISKSIDEFIEKQGGLSHLVKKPVDGKSRIACIECGHKFNKRIGPKTYEIKCPKCGGYDTEPD